MATETFLIAVESAQQAEPPGTALAELGRRPWKIEQLPSSAVHRARFSIDAYVFLSCFVPREVGAGAT